MRIHCRVVVIVAGFGVFLLLYFLGSNGADDPLLKEVGEGREFEEDRESSWSQSSYLLGSDADAKLARKSTGVGVRAGQKDGTDRRGVSVNAKRFQSNVIQRVTRRRRTEEVMHLAVVACGNRLDETLTMVKSAVLFSLKKIKFHIFAEDPLAPQFEERVGKLLFTCPKYGFMASRISHRELFFTSISLKSKISDFMLQTGSSAL